MERTNQASTPDYTNFQRLLLKMFLVVSIGIHGVLKEVAAINDGGYILRD